MLQHGARNKQAFGYVRVSTPRQAEHQTSLADQEATIRNYCAANGIEVARIFIEPGVSGTDETRPALMQMMASAEAGGVEIDYVVVHSLSRFFRDAFELESHRRRLKRVGVNLVSITQKLDDDDPMAAMTRQILAQFDEYQSRETSKHTKRTMAASASEGFWVGAKPPYGYRTYVAERRGDKEKKRLEIEPTESSVVFKMFDLLLRGDGASGPMGLRKIVEWLNVHGITHRGSRWHVANIHRIIGNPAYHGSYEWNKRSKSGELRPVKERVVISVPAIISRADFDAASALRTERQFRNTTPRVTSTPNLLTGLAYCGHPGCGRALTVLSGKGGQYHYYACSGRALRGKDDCAGVRMPRQKLDDIVMDAVIRKVVHPHRLKVLLQQFLDVSGAAIDRRRQELKLARTEKTKTETAIRLLFRLASEHTDISSDPLFLGELDTNRKRLNSLSTEIESIERQVEADDRRVTPEIVEEFGLLLASKLVNGSPAFRQAYARLLIGRVELSPSEVHIIGTVKALEQAVTGQIDRPITLVPSSVPEWCRLGDSNT